MSAYYNERDPYAAAWLRNLIAAGHIAPGDVDERSIADVRADDLLGYTQCHFFAGIGVWSHALRRAGWPDEWPVWTGSCPCQPFSAAGKQKGFDDERHLWPVWFDLIRQRRPAIVLGEQVASALDWLDLVSADMEGEGYAFGAADLCAAGFGGAHIRQRIYFVAVEGMADAMHTGRPERWTIAGGGQASGSGSSGSMADADDARSQGRRRVPERAGERAAGAGGVAGRLADADGGQCDGIAGCEGRERDGSATGWIEGDSQLAAGGATRGVADADRYGHDARFPGDAGSEESARGEYGHRNDRRGAPCDAHAPSLGRNPADWLLCRDGKWRPVEPGTFPLVDAAPARVGRLRAYGNALDAETAAQFCGAVMDCLE